MPPQPRQTFGLVTGPGVTLGRVIIEQVREGVVFAQFTPGPAYLDVKPLFDEFEDAVNQQMFTVADEAGAAIGALGLSLHSPDGRERLPVHDVQIMGGHDLSCRLSATPPPTPTDGKA